MSLAVENLPIRSFLFTAAFGAGVAIATLGGASSAKAEEAWCLSKEDGYKECMYATLSQCLASASGEGGVCDVNARSAYAWYGYGRPIVR